MKVYIILRNYYIKYETNFDTIVEVHSDYEIATKRVEELQAGELLLVDDDSYTKDFDEITYFIEEHELID